MAGRTQDFFDTHVAPALEEWRRDPTNIRLAMDAATELNQLVDYFWHEFSSSDAGQVFGATNPGKLRDELCKRYADFAILRDVAEAHKHCKLNRHDRFLTSAGQTMSISLGYGEAEYGNDEYGSAELIITTLDDGTRQRLPNIIEGTTNMWKSLLG